MKRIISIALVMSLLIGCILPAPCQAKKDNNEDRWMFSALFVTCAACYLSNVLGYALVHGFAGPALTAEEKQQIEREANKQENAFIWLTVAGLAYMATGEKEIKYVLPLTLMYVSF